MPNGLVVVGIGGAIFGLLAAATTAVILYSEWHKHRLDGGRARKVALMGGVIAWLVFTVLSVLWVFAAQDLIR